MNKIKIFQNVSVLISILLIGLYPCGVFAQASSPNYRLDEAYFGTGGALDAQSSNYRSNQSVGSLGVGDTTSTNYDVTNGNLAPSEPFVEMGVTGSAVDFGTLDPSTTSYGAAQGGTCNCSFYVRTYLSSSYTVVSVSQPPTSENGDTIDAKTTQGAPSGSSSVEEFGINLVANTSPGTFGANLSNIPDSTFADGKIATGYDTTNQYKYNPGDVIAQSAATSGTKAIGQTNYTISYIAKPSNTTEAGSYRMDQVLVVIPIY